MIEAIQSDGIFSRDFCIKGRSDNTVFEKGFGRLMKSDVNSVL